MAEDGGDQENAPGDTPGGPQDGGQGSGAGGGAGAAQETVAAIEEPPVSEGGEENNTAGQQCKAHVTLLRNLPSKDAVPQYERDEHNSLRLQEHWSVALRGLQD